MENVGKSIGGKDKLWKTWKTHGYFTCFPRIEIDFKSFIYQYKMMLSTFSTVGGKLFQKSGG